MRGPSLPRFHRKRAASERTFQNDAHEAVWPQLHALLCDGRAEDVPQKRLLARGVVAASSRRRVQREAVERRTERFVVPERAWLRPRQAALPGGARGRRLARDGGRLELSLGTVVALVIVFAGLEQVPSAEIPRHPADRMFEHLAHLPRL